MDNAAFRRAGYRLLIFLTVGITSARIVAVEFMFEPSLYHAYPTRKWPTVAPERSPTFSSNDRSRWAAVRALVEKGEFAIGRRLAIEPIAGGIVLGGMATPHRDVGVVFEDGYRTIDVMMNPETREFYSTKPPLFALLVAGEYWALNKLFGWTLQENRWEVVCTVLFTFNLLPILICLILLSRLIEEYGRSDWGRLFVMAAACFGTFLTTFSVTLNNHTPAACCVLMAVYPLLRGRSRPEDERPLSVFSLVVAGLFAGLAYAFELPAAAFAALLGLLILLRERSLMACVWYGMAVAVPVVALHGTNYIAHGEFWKLPYTKFGTPWYEYEGSHWIKVKDPNAKGIDFAREDKLTYGFHLLLGHHGWFSLTPIWLLALIGMGSSMIGQLALPPPGERPVRVLPGVILLGIIVSLVVIGFYIATTNNYGGWTSGPRWLFWLTPLFLLALLPAADRLARSCTGRFFAHTLLAVSAFSAFYPTWNPWRHPWIFQLCEYIKGTPLY